MPHTGVSIQPKASNRKLSPVKTHLLPNGRKRNEPLGPFCASTYTSIAATCPDTCAFKGNGCYVTSGITVGMMRKLDYKAAGMTGLDVSRNEADAIDNLWKRGVPQDGAKGGRDMRLHVGGDVSCEDGTRAISAAVRRFRERGGGDVWGNTHRWREIPADAWDGISIFASTESLADADEAHEKGYQVSIVVDHHQSEKAYRVNDWTFIPCPAEHSDTTCVECRACLHGRLRNRKIAIAFAAHGPGANKVKRSLPVLGAS